MNACIAEITWMMGQTSLRRVAITSYIQFEVFIKDIEQLNWVEVGRVGPQQTSLRVRIPPNGINTSYYLRARSVNGSIEDSNDVMAPDNFTAYTEGG